MKLYTYESHEEYLKIQKHRHCRSKERTRSKHRREARNNDIAVIKKSYPDAASVLCLGSRDPEEPRTFVKAGFKSLGIDVVESGVEIIKVMDMHDIAKEWSEDDWDVIYMSHSLEHSDNPKQLLGDVLTIAKFGAYIILPVKHEPDVKDPVVFDFMANDRCAIEDIKHDLDVLLGRNDVCISHLQHRSPGGHKEIVFFVNF